MAEIEVRQMADSKTSQKSQNEFYLACMYGKTDEVTDLVENHGFIPDTKALNLSVEGSIDTVRFLLEKGAKPDEDTIHFATTFPEREAYEKIELLIQYGGIISPLKFGQLCGDEIINPKIIGLLLNTGVIVNMRTLIFACTGKNLEIVKMIIEAIEKMNYVIKMDGVYTVLKRELFMTIIASGHWSVQPSFFPLLVEAGLEMDNHTYSNACFSGQIPIITGVISIGGKPNSGTIPAILRIPDQETRIKVAKLALEDQGYEPLYHLTLHSHMRYYTKH